MVKSASENVPSSSAPSNTTDNSFVPVTVADTTVGTALSIIIELVPEVKLGLLKVAVFPASSSTVNTITIGPSLSNVPSSTSNCISNSSPLKPDMPPFSPGVPRPSPLIVTSDGHVLKTILETPTTGLKHNFCVVMTHGIFTDKREKGRFDRFAEKLITNGFEVLRFDFRGHGESEFDSQKFSVIGALLDYLTVLQWVEQQDRQTIVVGSSFGGSIVLLERQLPTRSKIHSYVLLNPVIDYQGTFTNSIIDWEGAFTAKQVDEILHTGRTKILNDFTGSVSLYLQLATVHPYLGISNLGASCLVFHGDNDDKVSVKFAIKHFQGKKNVKLDIVHGAGHAFKDPEMEKYVHTKSVEWILENIN